VSAERGRVSRRAGCCCGVEDLGCRAQGVGLPEPYHCIPRDAMVPVGSMW